MREGPAHESNPTHSIISFFVINDVELFASPTCSHSISSKEVNGGFLLVENGSTARFLKNLEVTGFRVMCVRDEDTCGEIFDGGCVWNEVRKMLGEISL